MEHSNLCRFASIPGPLVSRCPAAFSLRSSVVLLCLCQCLFYREQTALIMWAFMFITESPLQQKPLKSNLKHLPVQDKTVLWVPYYECLTLIVPSQLLPKSYHTPCFMKLSTAIQAIRVTPHVLAGRWRTKKQSHFMRSLPLQRWQDSFWGDSPIRHVQIIVTSSRCHTQLYLQWLMRWLSA